METESLEIPIKDSRVVGAFPAYYGWVILGVGTLGMVVVVGIISEARLNWIHLLFKEGSVTTSRYFTFQDYQEAIHLLGTPGFKAKSLIQEQVAFAELFVDEGQKVMSRAQQVMRLLIKM